MRKRDLEKLLTVADVAEIICTERKATVYELAGRGEIPSVHVGRLLRFCPVAIQRWIDGGGGKCSEKKKPPHRRTARWGGKKHSTL